MTIYNQLINDYNTMTATHDYILAWATKGTITAYIIHETDIANVSVKDTASQKNGGKTSVRFKPNKAQKEYITAKSKTHFTVCTVDDLENGAKTNGKNKGQYLETLIERITKGTLSTIANLDFTKGGDININGTEYQIKLEKATFCNETSISNLKARA